MKPITILIIFIFSLEANAQQPRLVLPIGHTGDVVFAQFSPDGKKIVTTSWDNTAKIWDVASGFLLADLKGHKDLVNMAQFSPNGKKIVTASHDSTAKIWDAVSGDLLFTLKGHTNWVKIVQFSPDGKKVLTASIDVTVKIWDASSGILLTQLNLNGYNYDVYSAEFSPDGKKILTAASDEKAQIWDATSGILLKELKGHTSWVSSAQFSKDGKKIVTASMDSTAKIWNAASGDLLFTLKGHTKWVTNAQFSSNGKKVVTISQDNTAKIWDTNTGVLLADSKKYIKRVDFAWLSPDGENIITSSYNYAINGSMICNSTSFEQLAFLKYEGMRYFANTIQFSPDRKKMITTGDGKRAIIWDAVSGTPLITFKGHTDEISSAQFSPDGKRIISCSQTTKVWDAVSGSPLFQLKERSIGGKTAKFSPDGKTIVSGSGDSIAKIWDASSGSLLAKLPGHNGYVKSVMFSPDGKKICIISSNIIGKIWDATNGTLIAELPGLVKLSFNPDGKRIACTFTLMNVVRIWDLVSGTLISELKHTDMVNSVQFSPDGKKIVTACSDKTAKIWDAFTGTQIAVLKGHKSSVNLATFSPDGKKIVTASGDNTAKVWDASTGVLITDLNASKITLDGKGGFSTNGENATREASVLGSILGDLNAQSGAVITAQFSPDGKKILTTSSIDYILKVWDANSGALLANLKGHTYYLNTAKFSPDGKKIITASSDNTVKIWDAESGTELYTFITVDSTDYFLQIKSGYYQSTTNAAKLLHYVTSDQKVITFEQLDVKYNRPDKILEALGNTDTALIRSYRKAYEKRIKKLGIDTTSFREGYGVPEANFENSRNISYEQKNENLSLHIKGFDNNFKLARFNVWVNEVPVFGFKGISIRRRNANRFDSNVVIKLSTGENRIETSVSNVNGAESYRSPLFVKYIPVSPINERVHFIGIGINQFNNASYNLTWSVKDIRDLSLKLKEHYGEQLTIDTLFDQQVTTENVAALKHHLKLLNEDDKVIVAYSGHGVLSKDYDYFLSTYNVSFDHPEDNGLPYDDLEALLDGIRPRKKLMLIDACHSGELDKDEIARIEQSKSKLDSSGITHKSEITIVPKKSVGMSNSFELMQSLFVNVSKGTGATIISAAGGMQYAQESGDLKNGVFTYSILEAFNNNKTLTVSELKKIVGERVTALTNGLQKPTSRNETINVDWQVW